MKYQLLYEFGGEEKSIEVSIDYSIVGNGVGSYEFWGQKGFHKGESCAEINKITFNKQNLNKEEIRAIEDAISDNEREIIEICNQSIQDSAESGFDKELD